MSTTLSHGYKQPQDGDKGGTFWDDLADDIQLLNDHNHNGTNSEKLTASASEAVLQDVLAVNWVASGSGYRQLMTVPTGMDVSKVDISFREVVTGFRWYLDTEKVSATTYYVYCNDNTADLKAVYTT